MSKESVLNEIIELMGDQLTEDILEDLKSLSLSELKRIKNSILGVDEDLSTTNIKKCDNVDCSDDCEEISNSEEAMGMLLVEQEIERMEREKADYSVPKEFKDSELYQEAITEAYAICGVFKELIKAGFDTNNSMSIANNIIVGISQRKTAEIQSIINSQSLI